MDFDWNKYYELAEKLRETNEEAYLRSAISRVYYSVYRQARNFIELEEGVPISDEKSHLFMWNKYRGRGTSGKKVRDNGDYLHRNRKKADYNNVIEEGLPSLVKESFILAGKVLDNLKVLMKEREDDLG